MRRSHTYTRKQLGLLAGFVTLCVTSSFFIGMQSTGNVQTLQSSQAAEERGTVAPKRGDIDGDGILTVSDAILILERADELSEPTSEEVRRGDIDGDFKLTTKDVMRILRSIAR